MHTEKTKTAYSDPSVFAVNKDQNSSLMMNFHEVALPLYRSSPPPNVLNVE